MRLITFLQNKQQRIGVLTEDDQTVVDLVKADRTLPNDMNALIAAGAGVLKQAARAVKNAGPRAKFPRKKVKLLAPIPKPIRNVMCVGKNYYDHAHEFDDSGFNRRITKSSLASSLGKRAGRFRKAKLLIMCSATPLLTM
jgi:2-keto-4-pentenoate hydratase/2-oxohepta-3-ene-1,7-dioic acid hydratase in catechol pathway